MLLQILAACRLPEGPQWTAFCTITSKSGFTIPNASSEPPAMNVSVPAAAPPTPPETGASTAPEPRRRGLGCGRARALHIDGRAVEMHCTRGHRRDNLGRDRPDDLAIRQHCDHDLGVTGRPGGRGGGLHPLGHRRDHVEARDLMPGRG
jgi:hypothetical protein